MDHSIRMRTTAALAAGLILLAPPVRAETEFDAASVWTGENKAEMFKITDDHSVMLTKTLFEKVEASDATSPMAGATGQCFGLVDLQASGVSGNGYCNGTDKEGQRFVIRWNATGTGEGGALTGDWQLLGGAGKWIGATGGGSWSSVIDEATRHETNTVSGSYSTP